MIIGTYILQNTDIIYLHKNMVFSVFTIVFCRLIVYKMAYDVHEIIKQHYF